MVSQLQLVASNPGQEQALAATDGPVPKLSAHPLQALLCEHAVAEGELLIHTFIEELDAAVQALLAESRHAVETRAILDLGNALSLGRPALARGFIAALRSRFDPLRSQKVAGLYDLERLCLLPAEEMEESVMLTQLTLLADQKAGEAGRQLQARLQWAARSLALPNLVDALAPRAVPDCFAQGLRQAGLDTAQRVLAYRLVESHALNNWPAMVHSALIKLDQQGLRGPRALAENAALEAVPKVSAATLQTLKEARASLVSGADGALATALLRAVEPPASLTGAGLLTALAGAWVDGLLAEPELPVAFAPDLESLRLSVIKAALCDASFFTQPFHAVRKAVDELVQKAAFIGVQGYSLSPLRLELKEVVGRINIHGQFALDALAMLQPLEPDLAQRFRTQSENDQEARRDSLLNRVRALATREIEARTLDVSLPSAARAALTRGFLPLLATLLLRHGAASPHTRQARQLLERFVDSFALCTRSDERRDVLKELGAVLLEVGLAQARVDAAITELESAYAELEEEAHNNLRAPETAEAQQEINSILADIDAMAASTLTPPSSYTQTPSSFTPMQASNEPQEPIAGNDPVAALLRLGQWFRVRDYKRGDDRWLSLSGVHLDQDRLSFSGFDGATVLAIRASQFIEDLSCGLSEPLSPQPEVKQALERLRAKPANVVRLHHFG